MKVKRINEYILNENTIALLPAFHTDYDTIVFEKDHIFHVKQTALQLLEIACLSGGACYYGRRKSVSFMIGAHHKIPIPVNPPKNIYAIPTHSPNNPNCAWLFLQHIQAFRPHELDPSKSFVTFSNDQEIPIDVSTTVLKRQIKRLALWIYIHQND